MRNPFAAAFFGLAALAAPFAAASPPTLAVGNPPSSLPNAGSISVAAPYTLIDVSRPATTTGNLTQVKIGWTGFPCPSVVRIKVFHRTGAILTPTAQSAALSLIAPDSNSIFTQTLSPALPIQQGDLIGMTTLANCGNPLAFHGFPTAGYDYFAGDVTSAVSIDTPLQHSSDQLALGATGDTTRYTAAVVPGVGLLAGANGAQFKTSVQIVAAQFLGDVVGKLVFHPAGAAGTSDDPSTSFVLLADQSVSYANLLADMGQTGIGSLDVVLEVGSAIPIIFARVFNDAGEGGTSGLGEPAVDVRQNVFSTGTFVVAGGCIGYLSAPVDPVKLRFNLGMRSLDNDSTVTFTLKTQEGVTRATAQQSLGPNEFRQISAQALFGIAPGPNDYVQVGVSGGAAIVYGAATDNTTNDPAVQFATPTTCVA